MGKLIIGVLLPGEEMGFYQKEIAGDMFYGDDPVEAATFISMSVAKRALDYLQENYDGTFSIQVLSVKVVPVKQEWISARDKFYSPPTDINSIPVAAIEYRG